MVDVSVQQMYSKIKNHSYDISNRANLWFRLKPCKQGKLKLKWLV